MWRATGDWNADAVVDGTFVVENDCAYRAPTQSSLDRSFIVWPAGTTWDSSTNAVVTPDGLALVSGASISGGGGWIDVSLAGENDVAENFLESGGWSTIERCTNEGDQLTLFKATRSVAIP